MTEQLNAFSGKIEERHKKIPWNKGGRKCVSCGEFMREDEWENWGNYSEKGKPLCEACYSDDLNDPISTAVLYLEGEKSERMDFGNYTFFAEGMESLGEMIFNALHWVRTDPWRGYYNLSKMEGWENVLNTWFGSVDGYFHGDEVLEAIHYRLEEQNDYPEFELLMVFPRTSNVCSCGIEVFIHKEDMDKFNNWLGLED